MDQAVADGAVIMAYGLVSMPRMLLQFSLESSVFINKTLNFLGVGLALYAIASLYEWLSDDVRSIFRYMPWFFQGIQLSGRLERFQQCLRRQLRATIPSSLTQYCIANVLISPSSNIRSSASIAANGYPKR